MNSIWIGIIICSIICAMLTGRVDVLMEEILKLPKDALDLAMSIIAMVCFWNGILLIAKYAGLIDKLASITKPFLKHLLPEIKDDDIALGYIATNIAANMFGLGSAATPSGLMAMKRMQEINSDKEIATRSMITFLVLNTSGVTLIPTTIIVLRSMYHSTDPTSFVVYAIIGTILAAIAGIAADRYFAKR